MNQKILAEARNKNHEITPEEVKVYDTLESLGIPFVVHFHEALFGYEDVGKEGYHQPGLNLKNMMVREKKKGEHYLVVLEDQARLDFKRYKEITGWSSKTAFAGEEDLKKYLGVHSGSCSIFGLINDSEHHVVVVLDKYVTSADDSEMISFHPNINTATVTITVGDMYKFLKWTGNRVIKEE